ncbi:hypothetical protein ACQ4PT_012163 [Festuca glaucescens]
MAPADATAPPLPNDVLVEIFLLLPAKSALRFRAVSKPWCHLLYDPAFIRERHRRAPGAILLDNPTGAISALPFPRTDQSMAISLYCGTASLDTFLHGCCDGLLLLSRSCFRPPAELGVNGHRFRYFVCNPATREFAGLPVDLGIVIFVGFYLHAPTAEYRVLCYRSSMVARHLCDYLVAAPGQNRARKLKPTDSWSWTLGDSNDWRLDDAPAIHRGCLHWMLRRPSMGLVVFDTISEEFRRMRGPVDGEERTSGGIIVVDGTLGASLFAEGLVKVWVLVNYEDEAWNLSSNNVLVEIFLLLPAKSVLRLRAVCKPWHRLLYNPTVIREHHRHAPRTILLSNSCIDTIAISGAISALQLHCTDQSTAIPLHCGTTPQHTFLQRCCDGLLLFSRSCFYPPELDINGRRFRYFVCNPATREFAGLTIGLGIVNFVGLYLHAPTDKHLPKYGDEAQLVHCLFKNEFNKVHVQLRYKLFT